MNADGKFWAIVWGLVAMVALSVTSALYSTGRNTTEAMTEMVKAGANPLDAKCALEAKFTDWCSLRAGAK